MSHERIRELFTQAEAFLINARSILNQDELVDLTEMEPIIAEMCFYIDKLPKEEAQQYQLHLDAFEQTLTAITRVLLDRRNQVREQLKRLHTQSNAHHAYLKTPGE